MTTDFPEEFRKHCNAVITGVWCNIGVRDRHIADVHWLVYTDRRIVCRSIDSFRSLFVRCKNKRDKIENIVMRIVVYDNHYGKTWECDTDVTNLFEV